MSENTFFLGLPFKDDVLQAIKSETWVLDCPRMELVPLTEDDRVQHKGSGYIALRHGFFEFKLFSDPEFPPLSVTLEPTGSPGKFLTDSDFYQLNATDISGRTWQAGEIYPIFTKGTGIVASGEIYEIRYRAQRPPNMPQNGMELWFPEELRLPYNQVTHSVSRVEEEIVAESLTADAAIFSSSGYKLTVRTDKGWTWILASKQGDLSQALETRIQESLEFILGRSLQAMIVYELNATEIITTIKPPRFRATPGDEVPPLIPHFYPEIWRLFDCFFRYVENCGVTQHSPISTILQGVFLMNRGASFEAQGLSLGVAVEGLLKSEYANLAKPTAPFLEELQTAKKNIQGLDLSAETTKRICGALNGMRGTRPEDRLIALSESGVISRRQIKIWKKLRNSTAHAEVHDDEDELLALCKGTLVLLYFLIFNVIGYEGPFTDYETSPYCEKDYPLAAREEPNESTY